MMDSKSSQETGRLFDVLTRGRDIDRESALDSLGNPESNIDYAQLRVLIVNALKGEFAPKERERQQEDDYDRDPRAVARGWLVGALARIGEDDPDARSLVRKHLDPHYEPNRWTRYHALAGLFKSEATDILELAQAVKNNDKHPWPRMLAIAILASHGDRKALEKMRNSLEHDLVYAHATLRALRTVPIEDLLQNVIGMVRQDSRLVYDAVIALGCIPNNWSEASDAAEALGMVIKRCHKTPWNTDLLGKTLRALGNLKLALTVPWLIEELNHDNPNIVFESAVALEKTLGTSAAVVRVVEAAANNVDRTLIESYGSALRWMNRNLAVVKLEEMMVSGLVEQQETARILLIEIGGLSAFQKVKARRAAITQYLEQLDAAEEQIRNLFETSICEARKGFRLATYMDLTVFILGIVLIAVSAIIALAKQGSLDSWTGVGLVTGGTGVLGVLYALIKDPRRQIRREVDHLMYLKVIFLGYLRQLHQADQAYTRRLLEDQQLTATELAEFSKLVGTTMQSAVAKLGRIDSAIDETKIEKGSATQA